MAVSEETTEWFLGEYERLAARLYLVAYGVLRNTADAHDAVQEAALRVYRRLAHVRDGARVCAHLHLSAGVVPVDFSFEGLDWTAIGDPEMMTLVDPLPAIGLASVVPDTELPWFRG